MKLIVNSYFKKNWTQTHGLSEIVGLRKTRKLRHVGSVSGTIINPRMLRLEREARVLTAQLPRWVVAAFVQQSGTL
jgi:hypothetical protein